MKIAIQPCGDPDAQAHYVDTIKNPVKASRILPFLTLEQKTQFSLRTGDSVAVWGVTPGAGGVNKRKWERLEPNNIALLYRNRKIFSQGRISLCIHNRDLALELWNTNANGETWEYIYFLDELQEIEIPITAFNKVMGYKDNFIVQGFNVFENDKAVALMDLLEIEDITQEVPSPTSLDFEGAVKKLGAIDAMSVSQTVEARKEAPIFRDYLFGGNKITDQCDICGRHVPIGLLVAAHIKKRSSCSDFEKRDPSVVMRACKLGCDELYERSYLFVNEQGVITASSVLTSSKNGLTEFINELVGKSCSAFNAKTAGYFKWHREHPRRLVR